MTLILGVPFTHLCPVSRAIAGSDVKLAAQDCSAHDKGAYTGEVSASMIAPFGAQYVILGHSERREYHGETSALLNEKMKQAYANALCPIYCVGEKLEERESGRHFDVVKKQIEVGRLSTHNRSLPMKHPSTLVSTASMARECNRDRRVLKRHGNLVWSRSSFARSCPRGREDVSVVRR